MASEGFSLSKVFEDSKKVLLSPKEYFSSMSLEGGIGEPILKALVYGIVAGIFSLLWSLLNISGFTGGLFGGAVGVMAFLGSVIWAIIGVFIGAVIVLIISAIAKGSNDFEANMRVAASVMVIFPINAFLGFTAAIGGTFASLITLLVNLYALYILYFGVIHALKAEMSPSKVIHYVLAGLLVLIFIIGLATRSAVNKYTGINSKKAEKLMKEYQKAAEGAAAEYQKKAEEMTKEITSFRITMDDGKTISDADKSDVKDAMKKLNEDNPSFILMKGTNFVKTSLTEDGYKMEYRDNSGYFRSKDTDLSENDVEDALVNYVKEKKDWKEDIDWEEI
jgi:hypothetical protein